MSELLSDQFERLLASLPTERRDAQRALEDSGFLDVLVDERAGGAGLQLDDALAIGLLAGRSLSDVPIVEPMLARALNCRVDDLPRPVAALGAAVLMAGATEAVLAMTLEYAKIRKQFGRKIGTFQAVQHQLAIMAEETIAATTAVGIAFVGRLEDLTVERVAIAKIRVGDAAQVVAAGAHAVHGAIGISQELPLHIYTARLQRWRISHGSESWWAERLGRAVIAADGSTIDFVRMV